MAPDGKTNNRWLSYQPPIASKPYLTITVQQGIVQKIIQQFSPTQIVLFEPPGEIGTPEQCVLATSNLSKSIGTSPISLTILLYTECNMHSVVICESVGSKQHMPLTRQFQGNHVRTNECVQHGQNVAGPGWDDTNTGGQCRDWEWNQWCPRGTKKDQEVVTNIALWKYVLRSSRKTWSIVLSNWNSINKALSCLTMLSCPRCGSGNLKDRKITQHCILLDIAWIQVYCSMHKEAHWQRSQSSIH